ncbi:hypothetical protein J2S00_000389 [Caldalkalibacillus uzonensis]|uniref:Uncharacterized protein n=1 Tax=Caldalkalibacillus uzonensis TaxID=353224 RepID=A0ABU0CMI6_9BACI|nr:hypothetical protein [Caldalkalibacillus uzonensis]MDQ0337619.1 hypothetical protein [Caldalkalibacillus uzonensis]
MHSEQLDKSVPSSLPSTWDARYNPILFEQTKEWYRPHAAVEKNCLTDLAYRHIFFPHQI